MKRVILSVIICLLFAIPAFCVEYMPKYKDNLREYGIGLYFSEGTATVYEKPDENSKVIAKMSWDSNNVILNDTNIQPKNIFAVFVPSNALSGFIALDEEGEYTKIIYNNAKQQTGWIKNAPDTRVYYWRQLFYKYGKTKGLYLFSDTQKDEKNLKLAPDDDAEVSYEFIYPKYIRLQLIKGNWALLKIVDYDNEQKVGWFKWRNSDGTLNMFPQFKG